MILTPLAKALQALNVTKPAPAEVKPAGPNPNREPDPKPNPAETKTAFISPELAKTLMQAVQDGNVEIFHQGLNTIGANAYESAVVDAQKVAERQIEDSTKAYDQRQTTTRQADELVSALIQDAGFDASDATTAMVTGILQVALAAPGATLQTAVAAAQTQIGQFAPVVSETVQQQTAADVAAERKAELDSFFGAESAPELEPAAADGAAADGAAVGAGDSTHSASVEI